MTIPPAGLDTQGGGAPPAEPPFPPAPIEEMLRALVKAIRTHQLYLPNNPVYRAAFDAVKAAFEPIWLQTDEFSLTCAETEMRWFGRPVLVDASKSPDSLPWTFYKDGVRELVFSRGFERDELVRLFDILQRLRKTHPDEDDLITMLWQADFAHLRYRYVDLGAEQAPPLADGASGAASTGAAAAPSRPATQEAAAPAEARPAIVNMQDFDATLYFLDERELEYLRHEIDREYQGDLRRTVAATLFDIFEAQSNPAVRNEVAEDIELLMLSLLAIGELHTVAYILGESQTAVARAANLTEEQRARLGELPDRLSAAESLGQLIQLMDEATDLPESDALSALFEQLRPAALGTIFKWLSRVQNSRLRGLVEAAAERLAAGNTSELAALILDPDPIVAAEAVRRSAGLKSPAAVAPLAKVLAGGDVRLRQLAVQALAAVDTPGALQAMERSIEDPDREVRVTAVRTLGSRGYRGVFGRLEAVVKGGTIRDADLTERMAFFEAYGAMCGDGGVAYLDSILNGKGFFGRREEPGLRACAAIALGRVGTPRAMDALRKAASEKDIVVRNAVNRALRSSA